MGLLEFKQDVDEEISTILDSRFSIEVTKTNSVPHSDDQAITFQNLDERTQGAKLLETCVLYVDMRRSTQLSLKHRQTTVAKLYSSFVRSMTRCANEFSGEVRGIIGDRVMVVFEPNNSFVNAFNTAALINFVCQFVLNKHFTHGDVTCGIGIDYGRMLATKTGIRRHGSAQSSYRSLVWLGRPANIASKLTDNANKPAETYQATRVRVAYNFGWGPIWQTENPWDFASNLRMRTSGGADHTNPAFQTCFPINETAELRPATPPILITRAVYAGIKAANPELANWFKRVSVQIPGFNDDVFGADVIFTIFRN
jgi:class 3 adenylate cyclase